MIRRNSLTAKGKASFSKNRNARSKPTGNRPIEALVNERGAKSVGALLRRLSHRLLSDRERAAEEFGRLLQEEPEAEPVAEPPPAVPPALPAVTPANAPASERPAEVDREAIKSIWAGIWEPGSKWEQEPSEEEIQEIYKMGKGDPNFL